MRDCSSKKYVGIDASGNAPFLGELSRPVILNELIVIDSLAGQIANGIADVPHTCPPAEPAL